MRLAKLIAPLALVCSTALAACAGGDQADADSAAATPPADATPAPLTAAQLAGTWNMRSVPESGTDTATTTSVLRATADTTGWTMTVQGRPAMPVRVRISGDSIISTGEPYESVRRKGVMVRTEGVLRLRGDSLVGITTARYTNAGADSVLRLRTVGKRAP